MMRSLADVCELEKVHEILDSAAGFGLLEQGTLPFTGREGERCGPSWPRSSPRSGTTCWTRSTTSSPCPRSTERWKPRRPNSPSSKPSSPTTRRGEPAGRARGPGTPRRSPRSRRSAEEEAEEDEDLRLLGRGRHRPDQDHHRRQRVLHAALLPRRRAALPRRTTARSTSSRRPRRWPASLVDAGTTAGNDLTQVATWQDVAHRGHRRRARRSRSQTTTSTCCTGIADDIAEGPDAMDPTQLDLAVDCSPTRPTGPATTASPRRWPSRRAWAGWCPSCVRPDPTRLAPSAPFDTRSRPLGRPWSTGWRSGSARTDFGRKGPLLTLRVEEWSLPNYLFRVASSASRWASSARTGVSTIARSGKIAATRTRRRSRPPDDQAEQRRGQRRGDVLAGVLRPQRAARPGRAGDLGRRREAESVVRHRDHRTDGDRRRRPATVPPGRPARPAAASPPRWPRPVGASAAAGCRRGRTSNPSRVRPTAPAAWTPRRNPPAAAAPSAARLTRYSRPNAAIVNCGTTSMRSPRAAATASATGTATAFARPGRAAGRGGSCTNTTTSSAQQGTARRATAARRGNRWRARSAVTARRCRPRAAARSAGRPSRHRARAARTSPSRPGRWPR